MTDVLPADLDSGHGEMDAQHLAILRALRLAQAAASAGDADSVRRSFGELSSQLVEHFRAEERWMGSVTYPERSHHSFAHELFMRDLAEVAECAASGVAPPVVAWLRDRAPQWLAFHIQVNDVPLGRYLARRGGGGPAGGGRSARPHRS